MLIKYIYILLLSSSLCSMMILSEVVHEDPKGKTERTNRSSAQIGFHAGLYRDMYLLKNMVQTIQDQVVKFNDLYMTRFDHKLTSLVTNVALLDGNIKNIQDKARSWDMLQHHITAWNEQMKSLDRKVDIISSGQEKMLLIDGKLGFLLNLEYNSQRTVNKLTNLEERFDSLEKTIREKETRSPSIYDEFAARGVLSTLKTLEQKIDKSNTLLNQIASNRRGVVVSNGNGTDNNRPGKGKFIVTCSTSPIIEELVKDMSSKVDLMYDKLTDDEEGNKENSTFIDENLDGNGNEYSDEIYQSDEEDINRVSAFTKSDKKAVRKFLKNLCPSNKKINTVLEKLDFNRELVENLTEVLLVRNEERKFENLENRIESIAYNVENVMVILNDTNTRINSYKQTSLDVSEDVRRQCDDLYSNITTIYKNSHVKVGKITIDHYSTPTITDAYVETVKEFDETSSTTVSYRFVDSTSQRPLSSTVDEGFVEEEYFTVTDDYETSETEYEDYFIDGYYVNVRDLSSDIIRSVSRANHWIDLCRNPGSERYCDDEGFFTIQSRTDGRVNFSRSWNDYKWGFGSLDDGNFWIGNEAIHKLTTMNNNRSYAILRVDLEDFEANGARAIYETFKIGPEDDFYRISIGNYTGNATDSFTYHDGAKFSTYDVTNDDAPACCPCSNSYGGGWWFKSCFESNLNGIYYEAPTRQDFRGIIWEHWKDQDVLAKTKMSIKIKINWDRAEPSPEDP